MPRMECLLSLLEGQLDRANKSDVFINGDTKREDILLRLPLMELLNADLEI